MATTRRSRRRQQSGTLSPVLRPLSWSAVLAAAAAAAFATPAYADPALPDTIPDTGSRPIPAGTFQLPGGPPIQAAPSISVPSLVNGPLAAAAYAKEIEVATLGDQLLQLRQEQVTATQARADAEARLRTARDALTRAQATAEAVATNALKDAAGLPPGAFGSDLYGLSELSRIQTGERAGPDTAGADRELARAKAAEQAAADELRAAEATVTGVGTRFTQLQAKHQLAEASLLKLRRDNAVQLELIEREEEAAEQRLGASFVGQSNLSGMTAHPSALAAVRYALAQLGDPYLWGAEGPSQFDCSGLMWAAYHSVGFELPRVSKDQFYATRGRSVSRYDLLPGDLIFFASGPSWTSIHHVGMYIGNGRMVHAPTTGDVVKISVVRWSRFYAATRIFGEVPAPGLPPVTVLPPPVTSPAPNGSTPTIPPSRPAPSPTAQPTPSPTRTPTPSPTPSPSPSPTTSPAPSPTSSPTPTVSPTGSPTAEPSTSTAAPASEPTSSPTSGSGDLSSSEPTSTEPTVALSDEATPTASTSGS